MFGHVWTGGEKDTYSKRKWAKIAIGSVRSVLKCINMHPKTFSAIYLAPEESKRVKLDQLGLKRYE